MKKNVKRKLLILLTALIAASVLTGCSEEFQQKLVEDMRETLIEEEQNTAESESADGEETQESTAEQDAMNGGKN